MLKLAYVGLLVAAAAIQGESPGEDLPLGGVVGVCPPEDGEKPVYLLDMQNIYAFYECANGEAHLQYCTAGLVFNPRKEICDFHSGEWEPFGPVGTCPETNPAFPVFLRDGMSWKVFYMCDNGVARRLECDESLTFDPYRQACFYHPLKSAVF